MKQGPNNRRSRSRGGGKRNSGGGGRNSNFESNGPDVKVRGSAQQVQEKYLALARDASSAGDRISAEALYQHAEHYYRIINGDGNNGSGKGRGGRDDRPRQQQPEIPASNADGVDGTGPEAQPLPAGGDNPADANASPASDGAPDGAPKSKPEPEQAAS